MFPPWTERTEPPKPPKPKYVVSHPSARGEQVLTPCYGTQATQGLSWSLLSPPTRAPNCWQGLGREKHTKHKDLNSVITYLWFRTNYFNIVILVPLWRLEVQNIISNGGCSTKLEKNMHCLSTLFSISRPNWNSNVMPCPPCLTNKRLQSSMDKLPSYDDGY